MLDWVKPLFCEIYNIFMEIKKILVALDGSKNSQRALEIAVDLAKRGNPRTEKIRILAQLRYNDLVEEVEQILIHRTILGVYVKPWLQEFDEKEDRLLETAFRFAKTKCEKNGIAFTSEIRIGDAKSEIAKFANKASHKIDMVVLGSRGKGSIAEKFMGSVSNYVLHKSKIPVLVVK